MNGQMKRKETEVIEQENKRFKAGHERNFITRLEDLPNDLLYDIFDYFHGMDLYQAFSKLNRRFEGLLSSVRLRLQIHFPSLIKSNDFHQGSDPIILANKHRVVSFAITDIWLTQTLPATISLIDGSFDGLESLLLCGFQMDNLLPFLCNLTALPRLFSLTIYTSLTGQVYRNVYQTIFRLPMLRYSKIQAEVSDIDGSDLSENHYAITPLQYLAMSHAWAAASLMSMCASTPQLSRLRCACLQGSIPMDHPTINLSNLTHLSIDHCQLVFDDWERLIRTIFSPLQFIRLSTDSDITYLDAHRWEQLISEHVPRLSVLNLTYQELSDEQFQLTKEHLRINKLTSSFWTKRQWMLQLTMDIVDQNSAEITYSVRPYTKRWYDFIDKDTHTIQPVVPVLLTIPDPLYIQWDDFALGDFEHVLTYLPITHLILECTDIFAGVLITLMRFLPQLDSLKLHSLSLSTPRSFSKEEGGLFRLICKTNRTTKINIELMDELAEVQFFLDLCAHLQYLEVYCSEKIDIPSLVRFVSMRINRSLPHLSVLCIHGKGVKDRMIETLQEIIDHEQLLQKYQIKFREEKVFIYFL